MVCSLGVLFALAERTLEPGVRDSDFRKCAAPHFLYQSNNAGNDGGEEFGDFDGNHGGDVGLGQNIGQPIGKHVNDDQRGGARIGELVHHLCCRIQRVGVHQHQTGLHNAKRDHRICQTVGHLNCHPVALLQPDNFAQIHGEII